MSYDNMMVIAWNDGNPIDPSNYSFAVGHTKGVMAIDLNTKLGVYLVHAMPHFPGVEDNELSPTIPRSSKKYG